MLFHSFEFAAFLALVAGLHFLLLPTRAARARKGLLLVASYGFYASWNPAFVLLLAFSTAVDFGVGIALPRARGRLARGALVGLSLTANLSLLGFFKYGRFLSESLLGTFGTAPVEGSWVDMALPVGISFYTLQSLSYTIDVYRGVQAPTRSALDFALYVSFFPQLVAGPIVRAAELLPQLAGPRTTAGDDVREGLARIGAGLVKKVVVADTLALFVDAVYAAPALYSGPEVALAIYAFAFQIYFDFSGYTDMAIGLARLFGVRLPENFDRPYRAASPREFWQRWHISLSTWLRDYLYVSLGGNRRGRGRTALNLLLTMAIGGLWHGAAWTFVLWGVYHGAWLVLHRAMAWLRPGAPRTPHGLRVLVTFHGVCLGWLLFRAPSLDVASALVARLGIPGLDPTKLVLQVLVLVGVGALLHAATRAGAPGRRFLSLPGWVQGVAYAGVLGLVYLASGDTAAFLYFQF